MSTTPPQDPYDPAYRPPPPPPSSAPASDHQSPGGYAPPPPAGYGQMPPAGPGGYGSMPAAGGPGGSSKTPLPPRPGSVTTFVYLMVAGAVLQVIGAVIGFAGFDDAVDDAVQDPAFSDAGLTGSDAEAIVETTAAVTIIGSTVVAIALWLLFAWFVSRGMGWARIVGTVLGGINGALSLFALLGGGVGALLNLVFLAIIVGGLVVLWMPPTSQWFEAVRRAKSGGLPA